jgi:rubrerythrin
MMTGPGTVGTPPATGQGTTQGQLPPQKNDGARPQKPGYVPSDDEKALIARVESRISLTSREGSRWAQERAMFENVCFYCGIQWIEYTEATRRFSRWTAPSWFPTPVQNEVAPRVITMVARMLRSEPQARVRPGSNDPGDREGARIAEQMIEHIDAVCHEDEKRHEAALVATLMGTVIAKDYWNPQAGAVRAVPQLTPPDSQQATEPAAQCAQCGYTGEFTEVGQFCPTCSATLDTGSRPAKFADGRPKMSLTGGEPVLGPDGQPAVDSFPEGELETEIRMPFNFHWDPKATCLRVARWAGEATYADLDWIDEHFPDKGPFVGEESGVDAANFYESSLLALIGPSVQGTAHYGGSGLYRGGAVYREYQERPSRANPRGLHLCVAGGVLLYKGDLPIKDQNGNPTGDINWTEFRYDDVPGRFTGRTPVDDMVPLQRQVNGTMAQIILNRKTLLNPWVLAPKGSGLAPGQVAMRPGATVLYNFVGVGATPQVVQGQPLPAQIQQERDGAVAAMDRLAADARTNPDALPQGTRSGVAFNFLREQGDESAVPRLLRWGQWIAERGRKRLLLAATHYREPRAVKIAGDGTEWQVRYWLGADLQNQTDVSVDPGTLVPRSQAAKTQLMLDAIDSKVIDIMDPKQRQQVIEALGLREFETALGPDLRRAHKENATMDAGGQITINDTDDHALHLAEHELVMKDPAFDSKPPEVQAAYKAHRALHKEAIAAVPLGIDPTTSQPEPGSPGDPQVQQWTQEAQQIEAQNAAMAAANAPAPPPEMGNGGAPIAGGPGEGVQPPA